MLRRLPADAALDQPPRPRALRRRRPAAHERGSIGLYHLARQVDTIEDLDEARRTLVALGAYVGESSHGATKSVYAADPDGNEFEVMWMLPQSEWGSYDNAAPVEAPDLPAEIERWAGVATAGELVPREVTA
ncbi:VOC family protein [Janibacter limosus]|uniref:VOC family protein n=1 Tax=Janibacter limosus TaxID=53458 RepID=UPI0021523266|nr:VOC family protein [Janibacter limosus]WKV16371.1 VOC family protein [Janibacter limosus]